MASPSDAIPHSERTTVRHLRDHHNRIKRHVLQRTWGLIRQQKAHRSNPNSISVVDVGFGRGGDIHKYLDLRPEPHVIYAIEPNIRSWDEAWFRWTEKKKQQRNHRGRTELFPIQIGRTCQEIDLSMLPESLLHSGHTTLVCCAFFSFAYLWRNLSNVERFLHILSTMNCDYLVLTFLDGDALREHIDFPHLSFAREDGVQTIDYDHRDQSVRVTVKPSMTAEEVHEWLIVGKQWRTIAKARSWELLESELFSTSINEQQEEHIDDPWNRLYRWEIWRRRK